MAEFQPTNPKDKLIYELMPILIGIGPHGNLMCYGSCFIAYSHMAITAKHVVDELLKNDPGIITGKPCELEYWIVQVIWDGDDHSYVVWTIDSISTSPHSDIAIIWLRSFDENASKYKEWKTVPITFDPPPTGATVRAFGLHSVCFEGSRVNANGKFEHIEFKSERSISTGIVKQHYWERRDRGMYNFPCFEIDAKFEHGMSGGFVITENNEICGIICGSLPPTSKDGEHVSYVTMLWPMMAIRLNARLMPDGDETASYRIKDLSSKGIFTPTGWERVVIEDSILAGDPLTIQYLKQ